MFGIMMTYHIIRETMSPIELLERDDYLLVSNIELLFKEIVIIYKMSASWKYVICSLIQVLKILSRGSLGKRT